MLESLAEVGGKRLINSGTIYVEPGEVVTLFPFASSRSEAVILRIVISEDASARELQFDQVPEGLLITFYRAWYAGQETSASNVSIASDTGSERIILRFSCMYIGNIREHLMRLSFCILEGGQDGAGN